jgi:hypothetical protein
MFITVRQLQACCCGALSLRRGRFCCLPVSVSSNMSRQYAQFTFYKLLNVCIYNINNASVSSCSVQHIMPHYYEPSFTAHSLGSLEPSPLTQLSRGNHVLSFFLCSFMTWSVTWPLPVTFPFLQFLPVVWRLVLSSGVPGRPLSEADVFPARKILFLPYWLKISYGVIQRSALGRKPSLSHGIMICV